MRYLIGVLLLSFHLGAWADSGVKVSLEFDPSTDVIADNYLAGRFFIYDCEEGHWTCVSESFYEECQAKRNEDLLAKSTLLRCAPIGDFPNKKSCFQRQLFMTSRAHGNRFCIPDFMKEKLMLFD